MKIELDYDLSKVVSRNFAISQVLDMKKEDTILDLSQKVDEAKKEIRKLKSQINNLEFENHKLKMNSFENHDDNYTRYERIIKSLKLQNKDMYEELLRLSKRAKQ